VRSAPADDPTRAGRAWRAGAVVALALAAAVLAGCGSTPRNESPTVAADRLFRDGMDEMASGGFERAIKSFERVEGLAAGTLMAQQAQLNIAYLHWRNADRPQALRAVDRFIRLNPSSPALDYALYLRGLINFNDSLGLFGRLARQSAAERDQRGSRDAYEAFRQLVNQFPESRYAADARLRMDYIVNSLAEYEVHVARYYFNRGAYVAAVNRAQQVVTEYPQTPSNEDALVLMAQSYDKLGLTDLRDAAVRVLRLNFPGNRELSRLPG
jgi:outer membrane protein assembly factor BamD